MRETVFITDLFAFGIVDDPPAGEPRPEPEQVELVKAWLDEFAAKSNSYPPYITSYTIKHRVERHLTELGRFQSISNGAAIRALFDLDYTVRRTTPSSPNVDVKIKFKKVPR